MGGEEIPPGTWGGEEIPPGGWRGGDDNVTGTGHAFSHYEVGMLCKSGSRIKNILGRSPSLIVFLTDDNDLQYESTIELSERNANIVKIFHSLLSTIKTSVPQAHKENAFVYLGHAVYSAFSSYDYDPSYLFNDVYQYIQTTSNERAKIYYLLSGFVTSLLLSLIIVLMFYFLPSQNENIKLFMVVSFCGLWGALISIFQRSKKLTIDPFSSIFYTSFQSATRIIIGLIFGCLFLLAYKAKLILGILNDDIFNIAVFSALSGFSERFIPELLNKLDYEKQ